MVSRRIILQRLLATGAMATTPASAQFIELALARPSDHKLQVLSVPQADFVGAVADTVIPATDSPSARDVGVVEFVDFMLAEWYSDDDASEFLSGLDAAMRDSEGRPVSSYVAALDTAAFANGTAEDPVPRFYMTLKELILIGFFTSEEGMKETLEVAGPVGEFEFATTGAPGAGIRF